MCVPCFRVALRQDTIYGRVTAAKSKRRVDEALRKFGKSKRAADNHSETALIPALPSIRVVDVRWLVA